MDSSVAWYKHGGTNCAPANLSQYGKCIMGLRVILLFDWINIDLEGPLNPIHKKQLQPLTLAQSVPYISGNLSLSIY